MGAGAFDQGPFQVIDIKIDILYVGDTVDLIPENIDQVFCCYRVGGFPDHVVDALLNLFFLTEEAIFVVVFGLLPVLEDGDPRDQDRCDKHQQDHGYKNPGS